MERAWIVAACGDIRGSGSWFMRAAATREVKDPFVQEFYDTLQCYVKKHQDAHFKYVGDGFMAIKEFPVGQRSGRPIAEYLGGLKCVTRKCLKAISKCSWPRPTGFRIRITCGDTYKIMVVDPNDPERKRLIPEFVEYPTNTAAHLLMVNPESVCLATEGVVRAMGRHRSPFRCRPLGTPSTYPESVNREDVNALQVLRF